MTIAYSIAVFDAHARSTNSTYTAGIASRIPLATNSTWNSRVPSDFNRNASVYHRARLVTMNRPIYYTTVETV